MSERLKVELKSFLATHLPWRAVPGEHTENSEIFCYFLCGYNAPHE